MTAIFLSVNAIYCTSSISECKSALNNNSSIRDKNSVTVLEASRGVLSKVMELSRQNSTQYTHEEAALAVTGHGDNKLTIYFK